jgi:Malectin domain
VPNGTYTIDLKFAELYWTTAGKRVFNVAINNQPVLSKFDILAQNSAPKSAVDKVFTTTVTNGNLNIAFTSVVDNAVINAIEIVPGVPARINAAGAAYTGSDGRTWMADAGYASGAVYAPAAAVAKTTDDPVYSSERYGNFGYSINAQNGNYRVVLKFAELYWTTAGKRAFNVSINNQAVLTNFDILAQANTGPNTALERSFPVTVTNGVININFANVVDNAVVSGIEILPGQ